MGMGVILGGGPCGRYKVRLIRPKQAILDQRAMLEDRLAGHELEYQRRMVIVGEALDELEAALKALDDAINPTLGLGAIESARDSVWGAQGHLQDASIAVAQASDALAMEDQPSADAAIAQARSRLQQADSAMGAAISAGQGRTIMQAAMQAVGAARTKTQSALNDANAEQWPNRLESIASNITQAGNDLAGALEQLNTAESNLVSTKIETAERRVMRARFNLQAADSAANSASANATQTRNQLRDLIIKDDPEIDVWCADWSTELTGTVGTIEVNGEGGNQVLVRPGFHDQAQYRPERDGMMQWREAMTPEQAYLNAAILPGWQKWKPTYRIGIVLGITAENPPRLNIDFRPIDPRSSAQDLGINQAGVVVAEIDYMSDFLASEFSVGDRVIVEFREQDWRKPVVIGFADGPKPVIGTGQFLRLGRFFNRNTGGGATIGWVQVQMSGIALSINRGGGGYPAEWGDVTQVYASSAAGDSWYTGMQQGPFLIRRLSNHEVIGWSTLLSMSPTSQIIVPGLPAGSFSNPVVTYFSGGGRNVIYNYIRYVGSGPDIVTQARAPLSRSLFRMIRYIPKMPPGSSPDSQHIQDNYFQYPEYYRIHSAEVIPHPLGGGGQWDRQLRDVILERVIPPDNIDNCPQFN